MRERGNLKALVGMLSEMFYIREEVVTEWEYLPPVGPRPSVGFVGLKNAGATCYMNSVLQQVKLVQTWTADSFISREFNVLLAANSFFGEDRLFIVSAVHAGRGSERCSYR